MGRRGLFGLRVLVGVSGCTGEVFGQGLCGLFVNVRSDKIAGRQDQKDRSANTRNYFIVQVLFIGFGGLMSARCRGPLLFMRLRVRF